MNNSEEKKSKILALFDKEDIKYIRFDILEQLKKDKIKQFVKKIGDINVNKK